MTETELGISNLANGVMWAFFKEDKSGRLLYLFLRKLYGLSKLPAIAACIDDKYKFVVITKDEYEKLKSNT